MNKNDLKIGAIIDYYNESTQRWHDMVITDIVPPNTKELWPDHDKRNCVVIMTYIEDPSNTKMYFYRNHMLKTYKDNFRIHND